MKWLKYKLRSVYLDGYDENGNAIEREIFLEKMAPDNEDGWRIARSEAYGDIVPFDDGEPEYVEEPTQLDLIEAQVAYTAMMTDTLLEA